MENIPEKEKISDFNKISQENIHELLFSDKLSWQAIMLDLINTEQLDPWDIDIILLANKYLEKVRQFEEADFFVSSKVLLAASLLLRLKSEILLNEYITSIDEILFGKKEEEKREIERIEIDEDELPLLYPKTPLPRFKKVSLDELMTALNKAMNTEHRRIDKSLSERRALQETSISLPKKRINIRDSIRKIYARLQTTFKTKQKIPFSELVKTNDKEEKIATFIPLLHLDFQEKIWLEQEAHFKEIWIILKELYDKMRAEQILQQHLEEIRHDLESQEMLFEGVKKHKIKPSENRAQKLSKEFKEPLKGL